MHNGKQISFAPKKVKLPNGIVIPSRSSPVCESTALGARGESVSLALRTFPSDVILRKGGKVVKSTVYAAFLLDGVLEPP